MRAVANWVNTHSAQLAAQMATQLSLDLQLQKTLGNLAHSRHSAARNSAGPVEGRSPELQCLDKAERFAPVFHQSLHPSVAVRRHSRHS